MMPNRDVVVVLDFCYASNVDLRLVEDSDASNEIAYRQ
jgi:hypothetical protein